MIILKVRARVFLAKDIQENKHLRPNQKNQSVEAKSPG